METVIFDIVVQDMCPKLFKEYTVIDIENNWNTMKHSILQLLYFIILCHMVRTASTTHATKPSTRTWTPRTVGARSVDIWKWERYGG